MFFIRLLWRLARRRWVRRFLVWLVIRLIRLFGWRRTVKLLFRGRRRWRVLAMGAWRATVRLLRMGRPALMLIGWLRTEAPRQLGDGISDRPGSRVVRRRRRSWAAEALFLKLPESIRTDLPPRLAHRRDELRRSVFAAVGADPNWQPPSRRRVGDANAVVRRKRPEIGDRVPQ
jgi:hypothetical protein